MTAAITAVVASYPTFYIAFARDCLLNKNAFSSNAEVNRVLQEMIRDLYAPLIALDEIRSRRKFPTSYTGLLP